MIEVESYPEPKSLNQDELAALIKRFGRTLTAAEHIGASEAFVRLNANSQKQEQTALDL